MLRERIMLMWLHRGSISGSSTAILAALLVAFCLVASTTSAAKDERLERMPEKYREWVEKEVTYIITPRERDAFLDLESIEEWEALLHPELRFQGITDRHSAHRILVADGLIRDPRAFASRVRAELHQLVRALSRRDWDEAVQCVRSAGADSEWTADRFESELEAYFEEHETIVFDHRARLADKTQIVKTGERSWRAVQTLVDPDEQDLWCIEAVVDLGDVETLDGPLISVQRIGT